MNHKLLALYGLKFNPFISEIPLEALYANTALTNFCWRIENAFIREGGFALISGDPGTGKSVVLRILAAKLSQVRDVQVGVLTHPSAKLSDFYRELGDIFGISLNINNRWHSFKHLRERWLHHIETTLCRAILIVDEGQEVPICVLNELRLLTSMQFDSYSLLSVVLAGDRRLNEALRCDQLLPLSSRIRVRLNMEYASTEQLLETLKHVLSTAGNVSLMTPDLMKALCDHALGNYRVLFSIANELITMAIQQERKQLDEKFYFDCFPAPMPQAKQKRS